MEYVNAPMVSVCMITYNHEAYIKQAIEGVLMQKCDFSLELIIGEDCSTEKTLDICKELSEANNQIRLLPSITNLGMMPNFVRTLSECRGKYIALCEGDDYWTDPYKLQKQVDFLEANKEYGLCCTDFNILWQLQQKMDYAQFKTNSARYPIYTKIEEFMEAEGFMAPCTWVARRECFTYTDFSKNYADGTYPILMDIFAKSKVHVIPDVTSVYRYLDESASHTKSITKLFLRTKSIYETQIAYIEKYNLSITLKNKLTVRFQERVIDLICASKVSGEIKNLQTILTNDKYLLFDILQSLVGKEKTIHLPFNKTIRRFEAPPFQNYYITRNYRLQISKYLKRLTHKVSQKVMRLSSFVN